MQKWGQSMCCSKPLQAHACRSLPARVGEARSESSQSELLLGLWIVEHKQVAQQQQQITPVHTRSHCQSQVPRSSSVAPLSLVLAQHKSLWVFRALLPKLSAFVCCAI